MSDANNPFAPPQAEVADITTAGPALAGRGSRLLAALADTVIYMVVLWVGSLVLPINPFNPSPSALQMVGNGLVGLVLFLLIQGYPLVTRGQTLGKMILGVRIVRKDGSRVDPARLLGLRYGVGFVAALVPVLGGIYSLVDALLIFRDSRQCLHDQIADTIVVRA